jgi:hypothetical protein
MRSRWFAVSSVVLCVVLCAVLCAVLAARAETRPHYGGTLRIETREALNSLPKTSSATGSSLSNRVSELIYTAFSACYAGQCSDPAGPFRVAEFIPGKKLTLKANEDYDVRALTPEGHETEARGRPYLDSIEITMGRAPRDQMLDLQLGRADVIDLPAEMVRRAQQDGAHIASSAPIELIAIVFSGGADARLRDALALSIDRAAIYNVLLGRQGEPTAALLPNWMTGYAFAFDASQDVNRARQLRMESRRTQPLTLTYDPQDALARAIAERLALDARAAGLQITPTTSISNPDAKLVRLVLPAGDTKQALASVAMAFGGNPPAVGDSPEEWYAAERKLKDDLRVVPIVHVPVSYGVGSRVKNWAGSKSGAWSLADAWLEQWP